MNGQSDGGITGRRKRKRHFAIWLPATVLAVVLLAAGCGGGPSSADQGHDGGQTTKLQVVASFFPLYDFATKIGGEHVDVYNLVPAGVDSHDWTPKLQDMQRITGADVFLYLGAGYEGWVGTMHEVLDAPEGPMVVEASRGANLLRLSDSAASGGHEDRHGDDQADDHAEGHAEGHGHDHANGHGHAHHDTDPHVWLSPKQAVFLADNIRDAFIAANPDHRPDFEAGHAELVSRLQELDRELEKVAAEASRRTFIVSHESFGYLARDYGLKQIGVMGLSPDAEPTMGKLREIRETVETEGIRYILFEQLVSPKVAETLADSLGIGTLVLNPLEGLTEEQKRAGEDYFSIMARNLTSLAKALD